MILLSAAPSGAVQPAGFGRDNVPSKLFVAGGRIARASGERQSAAWGGDGLRDSCGAALTVVAAPIGSARADHPSLSARKKTQRAVRRAVS